VTIIGTQMIINAAMFQTLRKLVLVKVYIFDLFFGYKKISTFTSICVILVTIGGLLSGIDTFSRDYLGIAVTMIGNIITVAYNKFTESFRRKTGVPNLKLLVYNCYMAGPVLFILIFISGEYQRLVLYFQEGGYSSEENEGSFLGFFCSMFFSCSLVIVLNCGFFMSNEKNSSLFTILLANTKDVVTSFLSYFILKGNKFTVNIFLGMVISTTGAFMFSSKSICDNMLSKSETDYKTTNKNIESSEFNKVEIQSYNNEGNNNA
jgi:drug/metabolite transporter (DMT)-like permease